MKVIGYGRVSTDEQASSGAGLEVQRRIVAAEAERRGWDMMWLQDEAKSGKNLDRPKMNAALALLAAGEAQVLVASKLDRVSRSVNDLSGLIKRAQTEGWNLVLLDVGGMTLDLSTPMGKAMAHMTAVFAELERDMISERTKTALAVKREQGVVLGRPRNVPVDVLSRITRESAEGKTAYAIARDLNRDEVPTAQGGARWSVSTVRKLIERETRAFDAPIDPAKVPEVFA